MSIASLVVSAGFDDEPELNVGSESWKFVVPIEVVPFVESVTDEAAEPSIIDDVLGVVDVVDDGFVDEGFEVVVFTGDEKEESGFTDFIGESLVCLKKTRAVPAINKNPIITILSITSTLAPDLELELFLPERTMSIAEFTSPGS